MLSCGHSKSINCLTCFGGNFWVFQNYPQSMFFSIVSPLFVEIFGFSDIFHNKHDLFRTQDDDLSGGLKAVTRKPMHMLNGQRQVPMQEAVHMLNNQELVICSDMITYVSLAQGQALQSETDQTKKKDLITNITPYCWNSSFIKSLSILLSRSKKRTTTSIVF